MGRHATHGLFINGLKKDVSSAKLREFFFELLCDLNITLKKSHIKIVRQNFKKIAFVDLVTDENTTDALKYLGSQESRDRLNIDFGVFAINDNDFCIKRIKSKKGVGPQSDNELNYKKSDVSNNRLKIDNGSSLLEFSSQSLAATNSGTGASNPVSKMISVGSSSAASTKFHGTSTQGIPESSKPSTETQIPGISAYQKRGMSTSAENIIAAPRLMSLDKGISVQSLAGKAGNKDVMFVKGKAMDAATSVSGLTPVFLGKFYHFNEMLGSETRNVEFKEGKGNYKNRMLSEHVGMYVCGFVNTLEGGTLYMGVTDKGQTQGVICSHNEEDQIRLKIDAAIKTIEPSILPNMYSVAFTPVLHHGTFSENLKVIEVCVHPAESHEELYEFQGKVYVRRDGSVQNFKPKDIKEWAKKKAARDHAHSHSMKQQLDEVTNQLQQIQTHIQNIPSKKSKVCRIL